MADFLKSLPILFAVSLAFATPAGAQDTQTTTEEGTTQPAAEQPAAPALPLGEEVKPEDAIGTFYVKEQYGDWTLRCLRTESGNDPCQIYQLLKDDQGNTVAEFSLFGLPAGQAAVAGASIATPLDTLLTQQVTIAVDGANPKRYPFTYCNVQGCFAQIGLTEGDIAAFKRGKVAVITITPLAARDQKVNLNLSLTGFTAAYDAVTSLQ